MISSIPRTACSFEHPPLNVVCTYGLKTDGVCKRTNERPALSRGVCVPPPASSRSRAPPSPPAWHMIFHIAVVHTSGVCTSESCSFVCERKNAAAHPRVFTRQVTRGWLWRERGVAGGRLSSRGLHGYIISQGYSGLLLFVSS